MAFAGRILIIVQNLPVPFDRRVWLEAKTLTQAGCQVSVISPRGKKNDLWYEVREGVSLYHYPPPPPANGVFGYLFEFIYCWLMTFFLSTVIFFREGFDVIQACNPPETYFVLGRFYKLLGRKFIFDHHDLSPEMFVAKGSRKESILYRGLLWLEEQTFKTADVVVTTNQSHKKIATTRGGVPEDRVFIVRSGPDFERLKILSPEPTLKDSFKFLGCYLGEMCPQDGVDYLLQAIKIFIDELGRQDTKFVLMGGGPALNELERLKAELGLDEFVEFTGRVSDYDLCRYLSTADICLDPDPYTEWADKSTMNKMMEYMAFGKPIIAFDLKETRYSAQKAAIYVAANSVHEFAMAIDVLLGDEKRRQEMGQFGLDRVQKVLAWDYSKPNLLAAYSKVLSEEC
ncbi:MAG: glycosyltransferase family 4 protein [Chloroflexi bacterium]|nr:glycosyltransferase family 4 protein [Chloroflexota bacterium]